MPSQKFERVLITGGAQGIGREMALIFAEGGSEVIIGDINEERLEETRREILGRSGRCHAYMLDVTDPDAITGTREKINQEVGPISTLVNNAGIVHGGPLTEVPLERHFATFKVNVFGVVAMTHTFLPDLIGRPEAHLINLASAGGLIGLPFGTTYAASKWAAIGFSDSVRLELKAMGYRHVGVTTVCPLYVGTGMFEGTTPPKTTKMLDPKILADDIITAARKNEAFLFTPWLTHVARLKHALPPAIVDTLAGLFGVTGGMATWRGHGGG
jgi:short-subunit dehydrogenase